MRRAGALACFAIALAAIATAAAWGQAPGAPSTQAAMPTPGPIPAPEPTPEPILNVRMLQAPDELDAARLHELATELRWSNAGGVVLLLPGGATIADGDDAREARSDLAGAASLRPLTVVPQDGKRDGDATTALQSLGAFVEPVTADCTAECVLRNRGLEGAQLALAGELDGSTADPAELLAASEGDDGGGALVKLLLAALVLAALACIALALARRRRPRTGGPLGVKSAVPSGGPAPQRGKRPQPSPGPHPRPEGGGSSPPLPPPAAVQPPRRNGRGQPAVVASVLEPEGYVELDGCLRRVRWAAQGTPAPAPGECVEIEGRPGRLWAFPRQSRTRPAVGA